MELTDVDRAMLAALKKDSRATVTTLAGQLGISRATVQTRLERLVSSRVIQRFTIDIDASVNDALIRAVMLIRIEGTRARHIVRSLRRMPEISELHTTNGGWDLVAQIEVHSLGDFDRILSDVRQVDGVLNSETNILLNRASG